MKDKQIFNLIKEEWERQEETVNLIPSENYASREVLAALGSPLVNKYSEGYPGARYYPGNEIYDKLEELTKKRFLKLFKLKADEWHVNVQPYSGSTANFGALAALMQPGEVLLGMGLAAGGHLTHGHKVNFSGKIYKSRQYGVGAGDDLIDYEDLERLASAYKPKVIISGATAYPRRIDFKKISDVAGLVGAHHLADISHIVGLVIAGLHPNPFLDGADVITFTTHKTFRGPRGAVIICRKELKDMIDRAVFPGTQGGPHNNKIAAMGVAAYEASQPNFLEYQKQIIKNAGVLYDELAKLGFKFVSGGTENHLMLIDLRNLGMLGNKAEKLLEACGINANRNSIPSDTTPFAPNGLRLGTPAVTSRGMKEKEMKKIAELITRVLIKKEKSNSIKKEVLALVKRFPIY